ncbi:DUF2787 domain-containing protein [Aliivibrio finisterrensis]|uniref:DUF2787 domain-containing protein n=1 Tax=Aliivibrio finisterrensis TaxID=511998 RepID=A0A4Q5KMK9_9GAMM|nr:MULTISPECIES: DUF2787 domain-containing protein [Aliivibrio]MDD9175508.1 DUF2787 domain-containing protein [Aliivibrio sp. S3TY1]MDD9192587.1 DUF2787 domain-containing protein [Aliivibrio sp. S2TY2]MDD9200346.1 DUF2787 domain-containing protein [Aliivibrio sp. S2MY1]RYU46605.1 DUF2787 domain-containing protein [Aliivibrio finisterrensis]
MSELQTIITTTTLIPTLLPVSNKLNQCLINALNQRPELHSGLEETNIVIFNFRDKSYSAENGGFHPVEIALTKEADNTWQFAYITDFAFVGNHYPELAKELDFDFLSGEWFASYLGDYSSIKNNANAAELYRLWEHNFLAYASMGMYDEIEINVS